MGGGILNFKAAKAKLLADLPGLCRKYLPRGVQKGDWWVAQVPWRADKTPSLGLSLTTGHWRDFGREGDRGDVLDFVARCERKTAADVVREMGL